jgi:PAS domain S-box-containing protein
VLRAFDQFSRRTCSQHKEAMSQPLRLLMVEDSADDAGFLLGELKRGGYAVVSEVVETPDAMRAALESREWDVITSDHSMPRFSAPASLALAKKLRPALPFIIVSGEIDLNLAVSLMKEGAHDFIQKKELSRICPAIDRALREVGMRCEREAARNALKISESRYRRLFETARDGILLLNADTAQIEDVNPYLIEMLGYSHAEFLGKKLWEVGPFADRAESKAMFAQLQDDGYVRYESLPLKTRAGVEVDVEFVSNSYVCEGLKVIQCNIRDITARKLAEAKIQTLNAELERRVQERTAQLEGLNRQLEGYSSSVSHDLRAPLRRIMRFADALREDHAGRQSDESMQLIQSIRAGVERMNALVEALLQFAHSSHAELKKSPVDLSAVVRSIKSELEQSDPARRVEFVVADGVAAVGDEQLLRVVIENLLANAWKFTSKCASPRIEFGVTPQADGTAAYFVRDCGVGFDMAYADKLFAPLQRLHSEKEFPGFGIGLATAQSIVDRHDGRMWADGIVDHGATFYFSVSAKEAGSGAHG